MGNGSRSILPPPRRRTRLTPFGKAVLALVAVTGVVAFVQLGPLRGSPASPTSPAPTSSEDPDADAKVPDCIYRDHPAEATGFGQWRRTLIDTRFRLPDDYVPPDLVTTDAAGFSSAFRLRGLVIEDLDALRGAAEDAGYPVDIVAAFRSFEQQESLFQRTEDELGYQVAIQKVARPGHSEHQLGTAIDFKTRGAPDVTQFWEATPTGEWMAANAYRFGFLLSYPSDEELVTCYAYEPWHYRYFGRTLARTIHTSGLTTREYLWTHR